MCQQKYQHTNVVKTESSVTSSGGIQNDVNISRTMTQDLSLFF